MKYRELMKKIIFMNRNQKIIIGICVIMISIAGMASAQVKGGTLTVGLENDVRGFDPLKSGVLGASGAVVAASMMETLLILDEEGKIQPHLATSWTHNSTQTEWTFKLRQDVKFHDGTAFTAHDVAGHFNRILDPINKSRSRAFITAIKSVDALDDHTVRFNLAHPWQVILPLMTSRSFSGLIESSKNLEAGKQMRNPIGTGPYIFESWAGGDRLVVKRNPDYWNKDKIYFDKIIFRILPDPQTRYQSIKSGDIDLIWTDRGNSIKDAFKDPNLTVHAYPGAGANIIFFNASKPPLDDSRVRAALSHAWNQNAVIKVTWKDTRPFVEHPYDFKCDDVAYREHDFAKARALLKDYGKPVKIDLIHTTTPRGRELGEMMQQFYKKVGVELTLHPVDQNTLVKRVFTNKYQISGWRIADQLDVGPQIFALSYSKSPYNLPRYKNPELDKLAMAMRTAKTVEVRKKLQCDIAKVWNTEGTIQWRGGNRYHVITRPEVKGIRPFRRGVPYVWYAWKSN